jgi:hypothetical protein
MNINLFIVKKLSIYVLMHKNHMVLKMSGRGRSSNRGRYRRMYELTGVPGWIRFGTTQGGRSGRGLGPCAEYLQRIGKFDEFLKDFTAKNPGLANTPGDFAQNPAYEKNMIFDQINFLEDELKELKKRLKELR